MFDYCGPTADNTPDIDRDASSNGPALAATRRLARAAETVHGVNYYCPEINGFGEDGFRGWWHAYLAYRSAPLGPVDAPVVTATFYNFAPRMVERAIPEAWAIMSPERLLARRWELMALAFARILDPADPEAAAVAETVPEASELVREAVTGLDVGARPLSAALGALPWPDEPVMQLWHGCTIWREYRGDGHNIALAAAGIDGVECHVLMSASGHGNQPTITAIRGWTETEWRAAVTRLQGRGLIDGDGRFTDDGQEFRADLELTTDRICAEPAENLGHGPSQRLSALLRAFSDHLKRTGEVPGVWPPPTVRKEIYE